MPKYQIEVTKEWTEHGTVEIEAEDIIDAGDIADEMLASDSDEIQWGSMDPGKSSVEGITEI